MKFDYIIQNPPYSGSLHLDFLKKGYELLSDKGKMVIIEPATWLINVRKNNKYDEIKSILGKHVYKVVIENLNKQFDTALYVPFSITYIDNKNEYDNIELVRCGERLNVKNLYDCNLITNYEMIWSIINKCIDNNDIIKNHIYKEGKTNIDNNIYFCKFAAAQLGGGGIIEASNKTGGNININQDSIFINHKIGEYRKTYFVPLYHLTMNDISNKPIKRITSGKKYTDIDATCLFDTKEHLENWKYNIFNIKLLLFLSIIFTINASNNTKDFIPWLVDKKYTDEEIYKLFNFTDEEISLIDRTIKKYERHSPWFKRYMCGPDSVSDEEVQKFINIL